MIAALALALLPAQDDSAGEPLRVLFLTHSAGFRHGVVARKQPEQLSLAEQQMASFQARGFEVTCTQDCGDITPEGLAAYDVLAMYTTGELPISEENREGLLAWIRAGGGLLGIHPATDTWYEFAEYGELIGGYFDGHPWHTDVRVNVEDGAHPSTRHLGDSFAIKDEIYQFRDFRGDPPLRVVLRLDETSVDISRGKHDDYPIAWCRDWGEGRAFYTALGHRNDVWKDERFLRHLRGGLRWAAGRADWVPAPPEDAVVLFDGVDGSAFVNRGKDGNGWKVEGGAMEVTRGTGNLVSRQSFGDALWHVEFRAPMPEPGQTGQNRGNSGVYVQDRFEVQVLDSYGDAPAMGTCGAIYGIAPAATSAARAPGEWQSYDIRFTAARFEGGEKRADARMSVWWNGVLIHDDVACPRATGSSGRPDGAEPGPLMLQDHGHPVQYRNIWVVPLHR